VTLLVFFGGWLHIQDMPYPVRNCPSFLFVRCEITGLWFGYCVESITENLSFPGLSCTTWARDWLCGCETFVNVEIEGDFVVHAASGGKLSRSEELKAKKPGVDKYGESLFFFFCDGIVGGLVHRRTVVNIKH